MSEHVYCKYLYRDGDPVALLAEVHERLADDSGGSFATEFTPGTSTLFGYEPNPDEVDLNVTVEAREADDWIGWPHLELSCSRAWLDPDLDAPRVRLLVGTILDVYHGTERRPVLTYATSLSQGDTIPPIPDDGPTAPREYLSWLDLFPPAEVDAVGRERLLSAPAPRVEELDDGSVLLCNDHPMRDVPEHWEAVANHLGIPNWLTAIPP